MANENNGPVIIAEVWFGLYRIEGQDIWTSRHSKGVTGEHRGRVISMTPSRRLAIPEEEEALADRIMEAIADGTFGGGR